MGTVVFIGAGPGAADLITVRGARRLASADVVLFDALTDPALRAIAPHAVWVDVGKRGFADSTGQATIDALLVRHARESNLVVRLKGGDPSVFGRLEEELEALARAGIACEVVPGVTAALAAAAGTQRPLTRRGRGRSVSLATAMTRDGGGGSARKGVAGGAGTAGAAGGVGAAGAAGGVGAAGAAGGAVAADTEVFYMAGKQLAGLARRLLEAGWPAGTAALVVSRAGWPDQIHSDHTLTTLPHATSLHSGRPTVVTVGAGAEALAGAHRPAAAPRGTHHESARSKATAPAAPAREPKP